MKFSSVRMISMSTENIVACARNTPSKKSIKSTYTNSQNVNHVFFLKI